MIGFCVVPIDRPYAHAAIGVMGDILVSPTKESAQKKIDEMQTSKRLEYIVLTVSVLDQETVAGLTVR